MNILLVEDNLSISNLVKKGLAYKNYVTETAYDGEEGLKKALSFKYDLIILDVMLPMLDGIEVCRRIKEKDKNIPILILSARGSQNYQDSAKEAGANNFMVKPFLFKELYDQIDNLTKSKKNDQKKELKKAGRKSDEA